MGSWRTLSSVQRQGAEDGPESSGLADIDEASFAEKLRDLALHVVGCGSEAVEELDEEERATHHRVLRLPPVGDVNLSARTQDAVDLGQGPALGLGGQVVQQEAGEHAVEASVG